MTLQEKVLGYLGLAQRGRKLVSGEFSTEDAVKKGKACVVIIAGDASENTKKQFRNMCDFYQVPCYEFADKETLGHAVGKELRASLALTDAGLTKAVCKVLQKESEQGR